MNITAEPNRLQVSRFIKTTRERAFAAWTNPEMVPHWFGPATCQVLEAKIDLRVGGKYRFLIATETMGEMAAFGEYREITVPSKLVFTWQWEDDEDWVDFPSVVTVDFVEKDGGTEVTITHEGLPSPDHAARHEVGWSGSLEKLAARAAVTAEFSGPGHFSWNELLADDVAGATAFYTKLLGWTSTPMPGEVPYTLFKKNGTEVAGLMKLPMPGVPPHWLNYVTVESCDAAAAQVTALGGTVCAPPFDVPKVGRIAVVQDPQGARFGLFAPTR